MALRTLLISLLVLPAVVLADAPKTLDQVATQSTRVPELPVDDFFRHSEFDDVKISPTGEYLAASIKLAADTGALIVLRRDTLERTGVFRLAGRSFIADFRWVGPERLLFTVAESQGSKTNPGLTGEIYGMDADGRNQKLLIGPRAKSRSGRFEIGFLNDILPDDDDHVLVSVQGIGAGRGTDFPRLERMNVRTGSRSLIARAPIANANFLADRTGKARIAWGFDENNRQIVYYREASGGEWRVIHTQGSNGPAWIPRFIYPDGESALIEMGEASGPNGLYRYRFADGETTLVVRDATVDPWFIASTSTAARQWPSPSWTAARSSPCSTASHRWSKAGLRSCAASRVRFRCRPVGPTMHGSSSSASLATGTPANSTCSTATR